MYQSHLSSLTAGSKHSNATTKSAGKPPITGAAYQAATAAGASNSATLLPENEYVI